MYPGTHAPLTPDKPAVIVEETGAVTTYAQLDDRSRRLAWVFRNAGLRRGDHVAFLSDNAAEVWDVYWAALRSGLFVTGVNYRLSPEEAAYIIDDCGARVLIASGYVSELAEAVIADTPNVEVRLAFGGEVSGHADYEAALGAVTEGPLPEQPRGMDML
jgi:fatty-acyl-CoA synthase